MEPQAFSEVCSDTANNLTLTPLVSRWTESDSTPFTGESPRLGIEDGFLSTVDSSAELPSLDLESEMNVSTSNPVLLRTSGRRHAHSEMSLMDGGTDFMSSLANYADHQQLDTLQQFLRQMESSAKSCPQDMPLSSEYLAKLLVPSAFDNQITAPTIMTPALLGPITSYSVPTIMPGLSEGNMSLPPGLSLASELQSPDSLPSTPNPQPLPPLSCILPSDYSRNGYPLLPAHVSSLHSESSAKVSEKKGGRKRAESISSYQDGRPVKKSKGGGQAGQIKFKKTEHQLAILRTYFSINKMPPREAIHRLSEITGLTFQEVRNWFRNARLRYKSPMQPTGDLSLFKGMPGIPEYLIKEGCNSQPANGSQSTSQPQSSTQHRSPQKPKSHVTVSVNTSTSNNSVATGGARRSERIRSGWRSAATMAALLEAEKYQLSSVNCVDKDCFSCSTSASCHSTRKSTRAQTSIPAIKVTEDEKEKPIPFAIFQAKQDKQRDSTDATPSVSKESALSPVQLTPPSTPSTSNSFTDEATVLKKQTETTTADCQTPPSMFHTVKDQFVKSFIHQPPNSKERKEMLTALVHELDGKEKASLHLMVSNRLNHSMSADDLHQSDIKDRAGDAWEKLEDLFKTTPEGDQTDQSVDESGDTKPEVVDEDMFEGLKGMFKFRRDYLRAVWKLRNSADIARCCGRKSSMSTDSDGSLEA
jgi:hypothetical protein